MVWVLGLYLSVVIGQVALHWRGGIKIISCMNSETDALQMLIFPEPP
jgi:hypothetical protein